MKHILAQPQSEVFAISQQNKQSPRLCLTYTLGLSDSSVPSLSDNALTFLIVSFFDSLCLHLPWICINRQRAM